MICKNCGTKFSDGMFYPKCGVEIISMYSFEGESQINAWESALMMARKGFLKIKY